MNWPDLLKQISQEVLSDPEFIDGNASNILRNKYRQSGWLGEPGATEQEILNLEQRLGVKLPSSYREFLLTANGFGPIDYFTYWLRSCTKVDWLVNTDKDLVELWESDVETIPSVPDEEYFRYDDSQIDGQVRGEYFRGCLMISDWGDAGFLALNPAVQHDGEWEAWHFANWMPGANRYRSFAELMQEALSSYRELKQEESESDESEK
ncbi:SMI1/KNR4 family protein [Hymenobacter cavernae]|uniref:SMI1/KNR4 family protein n=1 Tax=Hymenobacter cavernae TaxID=2044852 RepID=UPI001E51BD24|nr:SMI1/KNR4 family protein [Hymenobacter cavernae]